MPPEVTLTPAVRGLAVERVRSMAALEALRPEWTRLWERAGTSVFQAPGWLIPWARQWAEDGLDVLTLWRAAALGGVLPHYRFSAADGAEEWRLLGSGLTDTMDALIAPGAESAVAAALAQALAEDPAEPARVVWQQLAPDAALREWPAPAGWCSGCDPRDPSPELELPAGGDPDAVVSPRFARRLRADRRRLEREGPVRFAAARRGDVEVFLGILFRLHEARWRERGERGVLADPRVQRFHREAAAELAEAGCLRLAALMVGERPVGVYYGFQYRGRASYYLGGFDPAWSRFGVGNQVVWEAIRWAAREGSSRFDFLRGGESYKYRWGAVDRAVCERTLWPEGSR